MPNLQKQIISVLIALLSLSLWQFIYAQTAANEDSIKQQQRLREKAVSTRIDNQQHSPHIQLDNKISPISDNNEALPQETSCLLINDFNFELQEKYVKDKAIQNALSFLSTDLNKYKHHCIGEKGIQFLVHRLMLSLVNKGYITTRISLPKQDLSKKKLTFLITPGVVSKVRVNRNQVTHWQYAFPIHPGDILNIRDIEQGLEQIKRLSHQDIQIQIMPGERIGESDLLLSSTQDNKNYDLSFSLDNSGEKETGRYLLNSHFTYENLFNRYDRLSVSATTNANPWNNQSHLRALAFNFTIPYGYWTTALSGYTQHTQKNFTGNASLMKFANTNNSIDWQAQYLFYRNQVQKDSFSIRLGQYWAESHYNINPYSHQNEDDTISFKTRQKTATSVTLSWQHTQFFSSVQWDLAIYHQIAKGKNVILDAQQNKSSTFTLQSIDNNIKIPFDLGHLSLIFLSTLHGQYAAKDLSADQHISIGSRYTVRGFELENNFKDGSPLSAERGLYIRNTLYIPLGQSRQMFYSGFDMGKVFIRNDDELKQKGEHLIGAAIGIQGNYKNADYDVYVGIPINHPKDFSSKHPSIVFSLSYTY